MGAAVFTYKAVDGAGVPSKGEVDGASEDAVTDGAASAGPEGHGARRRRSRASRWTSAFGRSASRPAELTVMTRQLATMISSGMTLLRAFYVLEDQVENKKLKETRRRASARTSRPACAFSDALAQAPQGLLPALRRHGARRARPAACSRRRWTASADQLEKDDALRRQVKGAMAYPIVVLSFAMMRADRPDRVHRPGVRRASSRTSAASCR